MKLSESKMPKRLIICLGAMGVTFLVMLLLMAKFGIEPFGDCSLAAADCKIQYLDFFNYYKDLLNGKNSIEYTLTKGLGGSAIGLFSYYLASPLNLVMLFFDGAKANTAIDLLIITKLCLAAGAFAFFLQARLHDRLAPLMTILLSAGYGVSFYSFANGCNLMWLDGMILLPFMLLGTYHVVRRRCLAPLVVPTALSVLANWYTGGINCLFCIIWLAFEFFMSESDPETGPAVPVPNVRGTGKSGPAGGGSSGSGVAGGGSSGSGAAGGGASGSGPAGGGASGSGPSGCLGRLPGAVLRYGAAMVLGILISAAIFLPAAAVMQQGRGSGFNMDLFMANTLKGNILNTVSQYRIGGKSAEEYVCLYCGSLAAIGTLAFFFTRRIRIRRKIIAGALLGVTLLTYYWQPLYFAFSLFKKVDSYHSRYGYIGSLVLLFLAAMYLQHVVPAGEAAEEERAVNGELKKAECLLPVLCGALFCVLLLTVGDHPALGAEGVMATCLCMLGAGAATAGILAVRSGCWKSAHGHDSRRSLAASRLAAGTAAVLLLLITVGELYASGTHVISYRRLHGVERYAGYVSDARKQVEELKAFDSSLYRISQIGWRELYPETGLTACYNDALAYNYMGIGGYSSSPENEQLNLLNRLGYKQQYRSMNIVDTSFLPADSVLGVRYVFSNTEIPGMSAVSGLGVYNGRATYLNPYALPIASVYGGGHMPAHKYHDPFRYLEEIWTALSGERADIFREAEAEKTVTGNTITWDLKVPAGNVCLYGDMPTREMAFATLKAGTAAPIGYSQWLAPEIFTIPYEKGAGSVRVELTSEKAFEPDYELFYALDLDRLRELSDKIGKGADRVTDFSLENGSMSCTVTAHEGEKLFLILPQSAGWHTTLNGSEIQTEKFARCLTVIPLVEGENRIEGVYRAPYLRAGIAVSAAGVLLLAAYEFVRRENR